MKNLPAIAGPCATRRVKSWVGGAVASLGLVFAMTGVAQAAAPTAGTLIGNQASATYTDSSTLQQVATSNLVQTTVQQVGAFSLTADNTKTVAAGQTAYMPHTLTNLGNGTDSFTITGTNDPLFSRAEIFADVNADGVPDSTTPLCSLTSAPSCTTGIPVSLPAGGVFNYVVALTVPTSVSGSVTPYATAPTTATSAFDGVTVSNTDTVNVTTNAAFNVTKAVAVPGAGISAPAGLGNWPAALTSTPRSASTCAADLNTAAGTADCYFTTYTLTYKNTGAAVGNVFLEDVIPAGLTYKNTGAAAGNVFLEDNIPAGLTYVPDSAKWSTGNAALTDATGGDAAGIGFSATGNTLKAFISGVGPNVTGTVSFVVMINSNADLGTGETTNFANYTPLSCGADLATCDGAPTVPTNDAPINVLQSFSVVANNASNGGTTGIDGAVYSSATPGNLVAVANGAPGSQVSFDNYIHNTGNGTDTFNITLSSPTINGLSITPVLFQADGATPLTDSNGDGTVDTGPMLPGTSVKVVLKYTIPTGACTPSCPTGPFDVIKTATSLGNGSKIDAVTDRLTALTLPTVDLLNSPTGQAAANPFVTDIGPGALGAVVNNYAVTAGSAVQIPLHVKNGGGAADTFNLSVAVPPTSLPAGWTVTFTAGTCGSGGAVITNTGSIAAGATAPFCAVVTTTAGSAAATTVINFRVTSVSTGANDVKADSVTINALASLNVTPDQLGQIAPGGTVVYPFTVENNGNVTCGGDFGVTANLDAAAAALGWTATIFVDLNDDGQIDAGDTPLGGSPATWASSLTAGTSAKLLVRVFAPGGASAGAQSVVTLTVTDANATDGICNPDSATGTTTVINGQLRVQKTQALDAGCDGTADTAFSADLIPAAKPGACILYKVVATNEGSQQVTDVVINDAVPAYTAYDATPAATCEVGGGSTPTLGLAATNGASGVRCGTQAVLLPGGTLTLTFGVTINTN